MPPATHLLSLLSHDQPNNPACCQKAATSVGRRRMRRDKPRTWVRSPKRLRAQVRQFVVLPVAPMYSTGFSAGA
jgi:hypothetical protein